MTVSDQWAVRQELRERFPNKPWLDVFSKADLLHQVFSAADRMARANPEYNFAGPQDWARAMEGQHAQTVQFHSTDVDATAGHGNALESSGTDTFDLGSERGRDAVAVAVALRDAMRVSCLNEVGLLALMDAVMRMLGQDVTPDAHLEHCNEGSPDGNVSTGR